MTISNEQNFSFSQISQAEMSIIVKELHVSLVGKFKCGGNQSKKFTSKKISPLQPKKKKNWKNDDLIATVLKNVLTLQTKQKIRLKFELN